MKLVINGELKEVPNVCTLPELIHALELPAHSLLVEHNGIALHRDEWMDRPLSDGDRLEFLRIAAGG
jgi:sulfur carrier protein